MYHLLPMLEHGEQAIHLGGLAYKPIGLTYHVSRSVCLRVLQNCCSDATDLLPTYCRAAAESHRDVIHSKFDVSWPGVI